MNHTFMDSPVGELLLAGDEHGLRMIGFPEHGRRRAPPPDWREDAGALRLVVRQLEQYFRGARATFELELAPVGTAFQLRVWSELTRIPYGGTIAYGELARRIGDPNASRAVGAANGRNPLPIVVPCHRVIGADGSLTGFGGGLAAKSTLLALEQGGRSAATHPVAAKATNPPGCSVGATAPTSRPRPHCLLRSSALRPTK